MTFRFVWMFTILASVMSLAQTNPLPFVSQALNPESVVPRGPEFSLTVNGANFVSGSVVNWSGNPLVTTFVSAGRLTAIVPAANISAQGMARITVVNPAPGGGISNVVFLSVARPILSSSVLLNKVDYVTGFTPNALIAGDFNGDGKLDVVAIKPSNIAVLLGNGDGTFGSPVVSAGNPFPSAYALSGDFNGDGKLDVVGVDLATDYMYVQLGNGDGTFMPYVETQAFSIYLLATGDFNGDGKLDVATGNDNQIGEVTVYFGSGDGTFYGGGSTTATDEYPFGLVPGDFNGDGILDLVVACKGSSVDLLAGKGDGTFTKTLVWQNNAPAQIVAGDLNNDGILDFLITGNFPYVEILFGKGDGTFTDGSLTRVAGVGMALGDLNSDGDLDISSGIGGGFTGTLELFIANGPGGFSSNPIDVSTEYPYTYAVVGDFNGDGRLDEVAPGSNAVSIFFESGLDLTPSSLAFPTVLVGRSSRPQVATLSNVGVVPITITGITSSSTEFPEANACGSSLLSGASCAISVMFTPTASGAQSGSLIVDSSAGSPLTVSLTGTGILTWVNLQPSSLHFGGVTVGTSSPQQTVTLTNTSTRLLKIAEIAIAGHDLNDFVETNNCGTGIARGASCTINVTFTPTALGARVADLVIGDNGGASPQRVPLTGTGI